MIQYCNCTLLKALCCTMCLLSCGDKHITMPKDSMEADTINIDIPIWDELPFSMFLNAPETIILETSPQCMIGNIRHIEMFEDKIYILDDVSNKMYVFDKNGHFVQKISDMGNSDREYIELADFSIDRKHGTIFLWDEARDAALKYDLETGRHLSTTHVERDGNRSYCIAYRDGMLYANHTAYDANDSNYEIRVMDANTGKQQESLLPSDEYNHGWNQPLRLPYTTFYSKNTDSPKYIGLFSNKIMSVTDNGVETRYVIESDAFVNADDIRFRLDALPANGYAYDLSPLAEKDKVYMVSRLVEMGDIVSFKFMRGRMGYSVIHRYGAGITCVANSFVNDYVCSDGQLSMSICYGDESCALGILPGSDMTYFKGLMDAGRINDDIHRYDELKNIKEGSNPVLFCHPVKRLHK